MSHAKKSRKEEEDLENGIFGDERGGQTPRHPSRGTELFGDEGTVETPRRPRKKPDDED
jgi:hypothetical protein